MHYLKRTPSKYRNKRVVLDGLTFDSRKEARYYLFLKSQKQEKKISRFRCQPRINLFPDPERHGRFVHFTPDFEVKPVKGPAYFVDVKSPVTRKETSYILRRKLLKHFHPKKKLVEV